MKNFDHLFRVAVNSKMISISLRKRNKSKLNFKLKLLDYKRVDPQHKNLKYKKILTFLKKLDNREYDVALHKNKKFLETGTSNLLFIQNKNIFSPKTSFYSGTTFKFFKKKIKITLKDIKLKDVKNYEEIILIGSGKVVTSVAKIEKLHWKRKSFEIFHKLKKIYNKQL
jgi:branched-subunit amino acid aminotransferase/4-amino-4-deoxychorismate lyase